MADVNANIGVNIDASQALAELKNLQRQISQFHTSIARSSATAAAAQRNLQTDFLNSINATGKFAAEMRTIKTASESFTNSLEKNKFSMGEYFRYAGGASRTFGKLFKSEFDTINKVAEDRVKKLQTQYIKMGRDANGALKAMAVTPLALDMNNLSTKTMIAAQRQQLFNELLSKGTTNLINFGKNTQWAGRQLMVGFTIPLSIFGSKATQAFLEIEQQALRFKRVYGDLFTSKNETDANIMAVRGLAQEFVKYGVAVKDTMGLAADAAASGLRGAQLQETVTQATRLAVLGETDRQEAFKATISMQTAFNMSNKELAESVNFLNAVENQSVTSLQDMTEAIPKVAPVIRGLGGDIKDMAVFLTAMKEGGVNAAESANGLKSALASMINPSKAAKEMLSGVGIDLQAITERNKGNLMRTVLDLGDALKGLEPLARTRILEKLFGKYQFARVSALFENISKSGSQAQRTMELMAMSATDLAQIANKELTSIEENSATKFKASVEALKTAIAPVGAVFIQTITPVIEFITKLADKFSGLSDHTKKVIAVILTVVGGIAPVVLMLVGLFANFFGQIMKFFALIKNGYSSLSGGSKVLGEQTQYLTDAQIEASAVAASLDQVHAKLTQRFTVEAGAVNALRTAYLNASAAAGAFAMSNPNMLVRGGRKKYAKGVNIVPGNGSGDTVPAMLEPGEAVIPKAMTKKYAGLINGMIAGSIPGYRKGLGTGTAVDIPGGFAAAHFGGSAYRSGQELLDMVEGLDTAFAKQIRTMVAEVEGGLDKVFTVFSNEVIGTSTELNRAVGKTGSGKTAPIALAKRDLIGVGAGSRDIELQRQLESAGVSVEDIRTINKKVTDNIKTGFDKLGDITEVTAEDLDKLITDAYSAVAKTDERVAAAQARMKDITAVTDPRNDSRIPLSKDPYTKHRKSGAYYEGMERSAGEGNVPYQKNARFKITNAMADSIGLSSGNVADVYNQMTEQAKIALSKLKGDVAAFTLEFQKQAELAGLKIGNSYKIGVDKSGIKDIYVESRQRMSPHPLAPKDGADDGNAYETARQSAVKTRRVASSPGGTVGPGGVILPTEMYGPQRGTRMEMLKSRMSGGIAGIRGRVAAAGPMGPARAMMGVSGAVMTASMMPGPVGDFAQKLMPATMGLQALATALPLLTNPIGATVAAFAGLAFLIHKANKAYEAHIQALKDSAKAEVARKYGGADAAGAYAKFTGQALPSSQQFNRLGDARFISADLAKVAGFKEFYSQKGNVATRAITKAKPGDQVGAVAADVASRAAMFGLGPKDIAANIKAASELVGANEFQVKAKVQELLAPGGKDILKEPLTVEARMNFMNESTNKQITDLQARIGKLVKPQVQTGATDYAGAIKQQQANANLPKQRDKQIRDTAIASELLKNALFNQTQQLGLLNQQYESGAISQAQYNAAMKNTMAGFAGITSSTNDLIAKMDELDTTGKTSKALLSDLADSILADFTKANKATGKIVKETLAAMPPEIQTNILLALSKGSLQPLEVIQFSDMLKQMDGKTITEQYKLIANLNGVSESFIIQAKLIVAAKELAEAELAYLEEKAIKGAKRRPASIKYWGLEAKIKELEAAADRLAGIDPTKKVTEGTGKLGPDAGGTKSDPFGDALKAIQAQTKGMKDQIKAYNDLKKLKYSDADATLLAQDANIAEALSMKLTTDQRKKLLAAIKAYNVQRKISASDNAKKAIDDQITQLKNEVKAMDALTASGMSAADALEMVNDQNFQTLILSTLKAGGSVDELIAKFKELQALQGILSGSTTPTEAEKAYEDYNKAYDAAMSYFDAQETLIRDSRQAGEDSLEQAVTTAETNLAAQENIIQGIENQIDAQQELIDLENHKIDLLQTDIDKQNALIKPYQDQIDAKQKLIDIMSEENNLTQHNIDLNNEKISAFQHEIDLLQRKSDVDYGKPLEALQDESDLLSHNLSLIDHQAEAVNKSYDDQQKALDEINKLNEQAIQQGKSKISIADALSQGDISAAAQAVQDLRANEAAANAASMQGMLDASRQNALGGLTAGGMTREQIAKRQWEIEQQSYALQQKQKEIEDQIAAIKEKMYPLEQANYDLSLKIQENKNKQWTIEQEIAKINKDFIEPIKKVIQGIEAQIEEHKKNIYKYEQEIYKIQQEQLKPAEAKRKNDEQAIKDAQAALDKYKLQTEEEIKKLDYQGKSKTAWEKQKIAIDAAYESIKAAAAKTGEAANAAERMLAAFKELAGVKGTTVDNYIINHISTVYDGASGGSTSSGYSAPSSGYSAPSSGYSAPSTYTGANTTVDTSTLAGIAAASGYSSPTPTVPNGALPWWLLSDGGMVPQYFAGGGKPKGTDTVPAMLTPGEFVMNRKATQAFAPLLEAINSGRLTSGMGMGNVGNKAGMIRIEAPTYSSPNIRSDNSRTDVSVVSKPEISTDNSSAVYNYKVDISINGTNMDTESIAGAVISKIKQLEQQQIRRRIK